jgi:hypothetical protein
MEYDYTHLNHNSLVSQKKSDHQRRDFKEGLLYMIVILVFVSNFTKLQNMKINRECFVRIFSFS